MLLPLVSHSPDLQRLVAEGYEVSIQEGHLLIEHVPFRNAGGEVELGTLVSELVVVGDRTASPSPHTVHFTGLPYRDDGEVMSEIIAGEVDQEIIPGVHVKTYLSTKPATGSYDNYHQKMTQYIWVIAGPARRINPGATPRSFAAVQLSNDESPFNYLDSASARAGISDISRKLASSAIGIVGLGGSGSYILDLVAKTPVRQIHLWDPDDFLAHNAFRAPGAATIAELNAKPKKVDYLASKYSAMHRGIVPHPYSVEDENVSELASLAYVFLAIDTGPIKRTIVQMLVERGIPFTDVGLGVHRQQGQLGGIVRVTSSTPEQSAHLESRLSYASEQRDEYDQNIQLADLNALTAVLAVVRWKKFMGFYRDDLGEQHTTFTIASGQLLNLEQPSDGG